LRNEGKEEGCGFRVQRFNKHAFPKCSARSNRRLRQSAAQLRRRIVARGLKGAKANPDQVSGANQFQYGEKLCACQHDGRDTKATSYDMNKAT
jgi:hypothetical protein